MAVVEGLAIFTRKPARIVVRRELSKKNHEYFTFITNEGGRKLLAYLNERILSGESLDPDDPVIAPDHRYRYGRGNNDGKKFMVTSDTENRKGNNETEVQVATICSKTLLRHATSDSRIEGENRSRFQSLLHGAQRLHRSSLHDKQGNTSRISGNGDERGVQEKRRVTRHGNQER
jgi:hypothetical protein